MNNYIELAYRVADASTHKKHKLGAVIVKGGSILNTACNLGKYNSCAERRAIRPHTDIKGAILIVVRTGGGISKPCKDCRRAIENAGIKKIIYINLDGKIIIERLHK